MVKLRWFPFDAVDWRNSHFIRSLSRAQTGAYVSLLVELWLEKHCSLPRDPLALKKLAQWDQKLTLLEPIIRHLITHPDYPDKLTDERLYGEWKKAHHVSTAHQKAAFERWAKQLGNAKPGPIRKLHDQTSASSFESVGSIADKHFKPI